MAKTEMIIEISPKKIIENAVTVWHEHSPDVDVVMDLKKLSFRSGSIDEIYSFHVLDHLFENELAEAISNWKSCLKVGGKLFGIVDNFEYVARMVVGGDIDMATLNRNFAHPMHFSQDNLIEYFRVSGFADSDMRIWNTPQFIKKQDFELIIEAQK